MGELTYKQYPIGGRNKIKNMRGTGVITGRVVKWASLERWGASIFTHKDKRVTKQISKEREFQPAAKESGDWRQA